MKYCCEISMKFHISFDEIRWNFNEDVPKNFVRIVKTLWKNMRRFRVYFAEISFRMRKTFIVWLWEMLDWIWRIMKEFWRNVKILYLRNRKFVKCPGTFQKNSKILKEACRKILKKRKANFEEIRWSKKLYNFYEIQKVTRILYQKILVEFVINSGKIIKNFCQNFKWILCV